MCMRLYNIFFALVVVTCFKVLSNNCESHTVEEFEFIWELENKNKSLNLKRE